MTTKVDEIDPLIQDLIRDLTTPKVGSQSLSNQTSQAENSSECLHQTCLPAFDLKEAEQLKDSFAVRKRFPRFWGVCAECGSSVIAYASYEHYIMGDW